MNRDLITESRQIKERLAHRPKPNLLLVIISLALVLAAGSGVAVYLAAKNPAAGRERGDPVAAPRSYVGKVVPATAIQPTIADGKIMIPLAEVDQRQIVRFELANDLNQPVPMIAYITTSGRLYTGSGICACGNREFSLAGHALVCNACRATYDIEDQKYLSGAAICAQYPPTPMKATVTDGLIVIDQSVVLKWRDRTNRQ